MKNQSKMSNASVFSFESGVPEAFSASSGSRLSISTEHFRDGKHALRWDYEPGGRLTISAPIGFAPFVPNEVNQAISTFGVWVYAVRPSSGRLVFCFGRGDREDCRFPFHLSFSGWRTARVAFERDMEGSPHPDMDTLTIYAPQDSAGTLYFDQMITCTPMDPRHHTRDEQVPFVNVQADQAANRHWLGLKRMKDSLERFLQHPDVEAASVSPEETSGLLQVQRRWDEDLLQRYAGRRADIGELEARYQALHIRREGGSIRGRPVDLVHFRAFYPEHLREELLALTRAASIRDVADTLLAIAAAYRTAEREEEKARLRQWFLDIADHLEDQGWAWGSSQGTVHHLGYQTKGMYPAYYLMRDVLRDAGVLERSRRMLEWYSGLGRIADPDEAIEGNADIFNTTLEGMMCALLMRDDSHSAAVLLRRLQRWMELSLLPSRGLKAFLKQDGAAYHHVNHYPAYALGALQGLAPVVRLLAGTPFRLPEAAHQTVRRAMLAMRFYSNKTQWLIGLSSRHPTGTWSLDPEVYREMAFAGTPDGSEAIDREMAAAYLRLLGEGEENEASRLFREAGIAPEPDPNGHWTMNFACAAFHRRRHWLVGVRGFSRYIWGNETYRDCNLYGRYIAYGHLEILGSGDPVNHASSGFVPEGWDWNRWPGTTVIRLPFERLRADVRNVDRFSGFEEMLISDETFAGGLSLNASNGMFAMKLHEHAKYNGSHRARKSYFFFDERIIALGSDIENDDADHETETTLFQRHLKKRDEPMMTASEGEIRRFPYFSSFELADVFWLMDPQGNGYVLPPGQKLAISRAHQTSPHQKNDSLTEGDFAAAWLSHGRAPKDGAYEFAVLVQASPEQVRQFAEAMKHPEQAPYVVLRRDCMAHIVHDRESRTTGYAWFEAGEVQNAGRIRAVDTPCMVMYREEANGELRMSVVDPDLRLYGGVEEDQYDEHGRQREVSLYSRSWVHNDGSVHELTVEVEGIWSLKQPDERIRVRHADGITILVISCKDAIPVEFNLT